MNLYQMSIYPDGDDMRKRVEECLGWKFDSRLEEGLWHVQTLHELPEGDPFQVNVTMRGPNSHLIVLEVEWP